MEEIWHYLSQGRQIGCAESRQGKRGGATQRVQENVAGSLVVDALRHRCVEFRSLDRGTSLRELMRRWAKTMGQCFVRLGEEQNSKDFSSQPTHDFPETCIRAGAVFRGRTSYYGVGIMPTPHRPAQEWATLGSCTLPFRDRASSARLSHRNRSRGTAFS